MNENKQRALTAALSQIEKQFGKGSIMRLGDTQTLDVDAISTGSLGLDIALGIGGLPMGRIRSEERRVGKECRTRGGAAH